MGHGQEAAPSSTGVPAVPVKNQSTAAILDSNTFQKQGDRPFHLKMSFQIFDLHGSPEEQGNLEYWWAGPDGFLLNITAPSLGTVQNVRASDQASDSAKRSLTLVNELLTAFRFPGSLLGRPKGPLQMEERKAGDTVLECMHPELQAGATNQFNQSEVCIDGKSGTIRMMNSFNYTIVRNRPAVFAGLHTALDIAVLWNGLKAIEGHVDTLESFDPAKSSVALAKPKTGTDAGAVSDKGVLLAGGVIAGAKTGGAQPEYPPLARSQRLQGSVVLIAQISPEGKVASLAPLASSSDLLTEAAINAVKTWTYRPYVLNGNPVIVDTTITVNFRLN